MYIYVNLSTGAHTFPTDLLMLHIEGKSGAFDFALRRIYPAQMFLLNQSLFIPLLHQSARSRPLDWGIISPSPHHMRAKSLSADGITPSSFLRRRSPGVTAKSTLMHRHDRPYIHVFRLSAEITTFKWAGCLFHLIQEVELIGYGLVHSKRQTARAYCSPLWADPIKPANRCYDAVLTVWKPTDGPHFSPLTRT